jgi:DNA-binding response OmpR family regulator
VEDNKDTLHYLALVLRARGHEVTSVERLSEAVLAVAERPFDLLISDIELPDGSGLDLMRLLRGRGMRALAMSGYGSEEDIRMSREAGFAEHLTKPVSLDRLDAAIQRVSADGHSANADGLGTALGTP